MEDENQFVEFVKPCPIVRWAGELNRDRGFLVNTESDVSSTLAVTLFNPDADMGNFAEKRDSGRLENVFFKYRRAGKVQWQTGQTKMSDGTKEMDFAADYADENAYGYVSFDWLLEGMVPEGRYDIVVETACTDLGGPANINGYRENVLNGVIDRTRPAQYGQALPLREEVIVGEEVSVVFTEPLDCGGTPLSFDIQVTVVGTPYPFDKDQLHVICEGRKIGFQIDLTNGVDVNELMGKQFEVEIGKIGPGSMSNVKDENGNAMDPDKGNIKFSRTFADLDLTIASASFRFLMKDVPCGTDTVDINLSDEVSNEIAAIVGLSDAKRLTLTEMQCIGKGQDEVSARAHISPPSSKDQETLRRLNDSNGRGGDADADHSVGLFYKLRDLANEFEKNGVDGRRLDSQGKAMRALEVRGMRIIPGISDMKIFKTHPDKEEEEKELYRIASMRAADTDESSDLIVREVMKERNDISDMSAKLDKVSNVEDEVKQVKQEMELMRKLDERRMEEIMRKLDERRIEELEDMHKLLFQSSVISIVCIVAALASFLHLRR